MAHVLEEVVVKDLVQGKKKLVYVDQEADLESALKLLAEHNILAMPVRENVQPQQQELVQNGSGQERHPELKFCGQLSVLDIASFVSSSSNSDPLGSKGQPGLKLKVADAMRKTAESWHMLLLDPHASVARAMESLGVRGFHRALVPNVCLCQHDVSNVPLPSALVEEVAPGERGEEFRVLSQVDLARFVLEHEGRFGLALAQTVEAVGLEGGRVLATTKDEKLSEALRRMAGHEVSALAVVDKVEHRAPWALADALLLDTLSASDLRGCSISELQAAHRLTVGQFLTQRHGDAPRKLLTCTKASDLRTVLKQLLEHGVHRLWVTPEAYPGKPDEPLPVHGVVSLSDIVRIMRILPVTKEAEFEGDAFRDASGQFMWLEWAV